MPPLGNSLSRQVAFLAYEASSSVTVSTSAYVFRISRDEYAGRHWDSGLSLHSSSGDSRQISTIAT
jgi:hypothetical protein